MVFGNFMAETPVDVISYISPQKADLFVRFRNATVVLVYDPDDCFVYSDNAFLVVCQFNILIIFAIDFIDEQLVAPHHIYRIHDQTPVNFAHILEVVADNRVHFAYGEMKLELFKG